MPADLIGVLLLMRSEYFTQSQQTTFCSSLWSRVLSGGGRGYPLVLSLILFQVLMGEGGIKPGQDIGYHSRGGADATGVRYASCSHAGGPSC